MRVSKRFTPQLIRSGARALGAESRHTDPIKRRVAALPCVHTLARAFLKPERERNAKTSSSSPCGQRCGTYNVAVMRRFFTKLVLGVIGGVALQAQDAQSPQQRLTPTEIKWPAGAPTVGTAGVAGLQVVILKGDPKKPGLYTLLLRLPPNTKIQAHSHKDDRTAAVLSGDWYFGYGREFDEAALKELPVGSFYTEPPGVEHFGETKDQETIIEITGYGPTSTDYVDPKNDPTKK
jgi:uncharacterized RmlC-like cupin family protein